MSIKGNPMIIAESEDHYVVERGTKNRYYAFVEKGKSLSTVTAWKSRSLYLSAVTKGNFKRLSKPKEFTER